MLKSDADRAIADPWPWDARWDKRGTGKATMLDNSIRDLEKAGALIAAEIDRLLRERDRST